MYTHVSGDSGTSARIRINSTSLRVSLARSEQGIGIFTQPPAGAREEEYTRQFCHSPLWSVREE
ncbi:protein of unknown function [Streptomyces sp. KY75]|nr:protein of unknown function [Streptomyces sp. KY70]CAD5990779.1 protein of unknown function [Streptomyces sp. KY75]